MLRNIVGTLLFDRLFSVWEALGFHVTPNYFDEPIPDTRLLNPHLWSRPSGLIGIDMHEAEQLELLSGFASKYRREYERFPIERTSSTQFYLRNGNFESVDAEVLYCMIRHFRPHRIIEVGSGFSTLLCAQAILRNRDNGDETCKVVIDPYASELVKSGSIAGLSSLISTGVQEAPLSTFRSLEENDILFIDSSHVLRIGSDVQYLYMDVLPRLREGVFVHAHDIFLPSEYPMQWVLEKHRFWNEQYLLQAFLAFNDSFKVVWAGNYMHQKNADRLKATISSYEKTGRPSWIGPGSFWIRRVRHAQLAT